MDKGSTLEKPLLSKSEVIGNAFVQAHPSSQQLPADGLQIFILAGHETTAHMLANAIYFLAIYPEYQVKLQEEIDSVLGDSDHNETSYNAHYDALSSGWIAAIMVGFPLSRHNLPSETEKIERNPPPHSPSTCGKPPNWSHPPHIPPLRWPESHHNPPRRRILGRNTRHGSPPKILDPARENRSRICNLRIPT